MGVLDLFSKRRRAARAAGQPDVYQYEKLPQEFRVQVAHIWSTAIRQDHYIIQSPRFVDGPIWEVISQTLARELCRMRLSNERDPFLQCQDFLFNASTENALDLIELTFSAIDRELRMYSTREAFLLEQPKQFPDDAIRELNGRFREHRIGFQYEGGFIMQVDEEFVHAEIVRPALAILSSEGFTGASEEFLKAHATSRRSLWRPPARVRPHVLGRRALTRSGAPRWRPMQILTRRPSPAPKSTEDPAHHPPAPAPSFGARGRSCRTLCKAPAGGGPRAPLAVRRLASVALGGGRCPRMPVILGPGSFLVPGRWRGQAPGSGAFASLSLG